mmetsp:Transcript_27878/g.32216  ORF Transcript_27878/g.32216 Transcript_27878/m.32216 type:complete len:97 (+) Transcript_27878:711-1001(+)
MHFSKSPSVVVLCLAVGEFDDENNEATFAVAEERSNWTTTVASPSETSVSRTVTSSARLNPIMGLRVGIADGGRGLRDVGSKSERNRRREPSPPRR